MRNLKNSLIKLVGKENVKTNINIKNFLTFHTDTIAKILIEIYNKSTLIKVLDFLRSENINFICLGGGSNILFKRKYVRTVILHFCSGYSKIFYKGGYHYLTAFAGCKVANIINKCKQNGYSCLEWAVGIPASIGGATYMNMGCMGEQYKDYVKSVTFYKDGTIKTSQGKDLFFYRNSWFKEQNCVIISVVLKLQKSSKDVLQKKLTKNITQKALSQPLDKYSCGSTFKNGKDFKVAKLIEDANLKDLNIGGAVVSHKHSNFIINESNATSKDIIKLINLVKKEIYKKYKIKIVEEIVIY